jgi:hypothetical protein
MNHQLYEASVKALTDRGVPVSAAEKASVVVAKDDGSKPDFGRTEQDQKHIKDAMTWMNAERISSSS